jgi:hypothetical protein
MKPAFDHDSKQIHIVYFSCAKHWPYLSVSLRSLKKLNCNRVGSISLYIDRDDYLDSGKIAELDRLFPGINIAKSRRVTGWGEETVAVETQVFAELAVRVHPESFIAKTDSDIAFRGDRAFSSASELNADLSGLANDRHAPLIYPIGGCYFIKARIAARMQSYSAEVFSETLSLMNNPEARKRNSESFTNCPEDAAIYVIIKRLGGKVSYIPQFSRSIMHFSGQKSEMLRYDQRLYWLYKYYWRPFVGRLMPGVVRRALKNGIVNVPQAAKPERTPL